MIDWGFFSYNCLQWSVINLKALLSNIQALTFQEDPICLFERRSENWLLNYIVQIITDQDCGIYTSILENALWSQTAKDVQLTKCEGSGKSWCIKAFEQFYFLITNSHYMWKAAQCCKMSLLKILNKFLSSGENISPMYYEILLLPLSPLSLKKQWNFSLPDTPCASQTWSSEYNWIQHLNQAHKW